ncbi:hypothetical protein KBC40_01920 [Patescibacteria group bacterium]|nr:hypothetical protein [Patescibacteria group bacterium]
MRADKYFQFDQPVSSIAEGLDLMRKKLKSLNEEAEQSPVPYAPGLAARLLGECLKGSIDLGDQLINEHREAEVPAVLLPFAIYVKEQDYA